LLGRPEAALFPAWDDPVPYEFQTMFIVRQGTTLHEIQRRFIFIYRFTIMCYAPEA
jgi:hypothetical protein